MHCRYRPIIVTQPKLATKKVHVKVSPKPSLNNSIAKPSSPIFEGLDIWLHFSMWGGGIGFKIPIPCLDYDRIGNKEGLLT
ncbi:unnamed protein product, partial [Vitis vinifera]|uniref:Uncharacterized protein n=1 Tax=Vitis vinifera TaxID=29760 RepID=D7SV94_VITVI